MREQIPLATKISYDKLQANLGSVDPIVTFLLRIGRLAVFGEMGIVRYGPMGPSNSFPSHMLLDPPDDELTAGTSNKALRLSRSMSVMRRCKPSLTVL